MQDFSGLVVNDNRSTSPWVNIPRRAVSWVDAVHGGMTLAIADGFANLFDSPAALPHLPSPLLGRFVCSQSQSMVSDRFLAKFGFGQSRAQCDFCAARRS
jgi:hypothetical protein